MRKLKILLIIALNISILYAQEKAVTSTDFEIMRPKRLANQSNDRSMMLPYNSVEPIMEFKSELTIQPDSNIIIVERENSLTSVPILAKPKKDVVKIRETAYRVENIDLPQTREMMAAPANDAICSAISLAVNGACQNGQTNIDATSDYYGGCVSSSYVSVWYSFVLTGSNNQITFTFQLPGTLGGTSLGQGGNVSMYLMDGACTSPSGIRTICQSAATPFKFDNLAIGVTYYVMVATPANATGNFNICATQGVETPGLQTGPEQNCSGAISLCNATYSFSGSYSGEGGIDEVSTSSCLSSGETNSVWYVFTPQSIGTFAFMITTTKDYDWALYDITTIGCAGIPTATPIRCNWSATYGSTGLTLPGATQLPEQSLGAGGSPIMPGISDMQAGHTYALIIDNWSADNTGFTINFSGTATVTDNTPPTMSAAVPSCTGNTILLTMSEAIQCLTVQEADFKLIYVTGGNANVTSKITEILAYNCAGSLSTQIQITHDGSLQTGVYKLEINPSPVLADKCDNKIIAAGFVNFNYLADLSLTPTPSLLCGGQTLSLNADGADGAPSVTTYNLNPGGLTNSTNGVFSGLTPVSNTLYTLSVAYGGCTKTATTTVNVESNIITTISPSSKTICDAANEVLTASTTINGVPCVGCTYVWSTTATTNSITVGAGTYTVIATTPIGCHNDNSPSTTLTAASSGSGGGSCDVIYVSPAGGGTGLIKSSPTTLANAISMAECTYAVIKMQKGIYSFTDYLPIHSYVTIEGGYDSGFNTKSSNLTGGTNSTTIRRSTAGDTGNTTKCSAFVADDNATLFRIQDIRIELPGAASGFATHSGGSNKTNYGIRLGNNCTDYDVIRCYIDAGAGSTP
jgi:hypothetical protein